MSPWHRGKCEEVTNHPHFVGARISDVAVFGALGYSIAATERVNLLSGMPGRTNEGLFLRCLKPLDDIVSVKLLLRIWGPRFEFFVRLILVATFLDDSIRVATNFSEHTDQVVAAGQPLAEASPHLIYYAAAVVLAAGLLAQSLGSLCLVALIQPDVATKALIGWAIVQPVLYAQLTNFEFVAESLSLVGGLLIMRAHLSEQAKRDGRRVPVGGGTLCVPADPDSAPELAIARTQLLGRLLLPSVYLYRALTLLGSLADANPNPNPNPNPNQAASPTRNSARSCRTRCRRWTRRWRSASCSAARSSPPASSRAPSRSRSRCSRSCSCSTCTPSSGMRGTLTLTLTPTLMLYLQPFFRYAWPG